MSGVGTVTNPVAASLFLYLFFKTWNLTALFGFVMMVGLWLQGDPWIISGLAGAFRNVRGG